MQHWDGTAWSSVDSGTNANGGVSSLWGAAANDIWGIGWNSSGAGGLIVRYH
jgi:hypothetical protein